MVLFLPEPSAKRIIVYRGNQSELESESKQQLAAGAQSLNHCRQRVNANERGFRIALILISFFQVSPVPRPRRLDSLIL